MKSEATCAVAATYYKSCKYCEKAGIATFTNGNTLEHKFDKKIEDSLYVSKPGTCTTKTEYYYVCSGCGTKGTQIYTGSETPSHLWSDNWHKDTNNHWHECNNCIEKKDVAAHKYDDYVIVDEPTTEVEGIRKYTCICGEEILEVIPKLPIEEPVKKGCKKDIEVLVVGIISLSMLGILLKKKEKIL